MINPETFTPPFCPNKRCTLHEPEQTRKSKTREILGKHLWFIKKGTRFLSSGDKPVQIYRCRCCGTFFCSRTFSIDYYGKRTYDYHRILTMLISNMGVRAMARAFHCSPSSIQNKVERLSRQAVALKSRLNRKIILREDLCADGFESFVVSQYHPNNFNLLVGMESQFTYFLNYAQLRRKGQMTDQQKRKAKRLKENIPMEGRQIQRSFTELTNAVVQLQRQSERRVLTVHTDEKKEYRRPLSFLLFGGRDPTEGYRVYHETVSGKQSRDRANPLFSVNYMDRELRKDLGEHVRETVRFARNVNNSIGRIELHQFHHNYIKPYRLNVKERVFQTHAHAAGFDPKEVKRTLCHWMNRRSFLSHLKLDLHLQKVWYKAYPTPGKGQTDYVPCYIYQ